MSKILTSKNKGYLAAIGAACSFGLIPLFSLPLLKSGFSPSDVLVYRCFFSAIGLALFMLLRGISFRVSAKDIPFLMLGGCLYFFSAWFLFMGYSFVSSGLATILHFSYPVFVALILMMSFGEKMTVKKRISIVLALAGVAQISMQGGNVGDNMSFGGIAIILLSGLAYACYIVELRYSRLSRFPGFRTSLYVMLFSGLLFLIVSLSNHGTVQPLQGSAQWINILLLALVPTIVSNILLIIAVKEIGSQDTSVLGSLEPLTALVVGMLVFGESISMMALWGAACIILSVILVVYKKKQPVVPQSNCSEVEKDR